MEKFETIDDVETWLAPMTYEEFWRAIRPHCLVIHPRDHCDAVIANGAASFEDVFEGLKMIACRELAKRHGLSRKPVGPVLRVVAAND